MGEEDSTASSSTGTSCVWPSLNVAVASTVPTSPSASSSCTSCTLGSICVSELQATDGGGAADHSTSVTTADCSTTVTDVVDTDSEAAVVDTVAATPVTDTSPLPGADTPYTTPSESEIALPDADRLTRSETSTFDTLVSPEPPKTATGTTLVCWYDGSLHASEPAIRLSVLSSASTVTDSGNHTVTGTVAEPALDVTAIEPVPPAVWLLDTTTVHDDRSKSDGSLELHE